MARQGTTPIITLNVNQDFTGCNVFVTIDQDGTQVTKSSRQSDDIEITKHYNDDGEFDHSSVALYLTQDETLKFEIGVVRTQIRWVNLDGNAFATNIGQFRMSESLLDSVIAYS